MAVPVVEHPQSVDEAMAAGTAPLERGGERLALLVGIGIGLPLRRRRTPGNDALVIGDSFDDPLPGFEDYS